MDIIHGFLRNYGSLKIDIDSNFTSWTFKSMDYFNQLGKLLGYWVEFEGHRYDQLWYSFTKASKYAEDENLFLHLEHENKDNRVEKTIKKLVSNKEPRAIKRIGIVYPEADNFNSEVLKFKNQTVNLSLENEEVTILFLGLLKEAQDGYWPIEVISKYISKGEILTVQDSFRICEDENEILYAVFSD